MTETYKLDESYLNSGSDKSQQKIYLENNEIVRSYSAIICEKNKDHILSVIEPLFSPLLNVLEVGSGTGQHAIYFARKMPYITWHTSDRKYFLDGINTWVKESGLSNIILPFELDVSESQWPKIDVDAVFTANTLHTMSPQEIADLFRGVGELLNKWGSFVIYGPFIYKESFSIRSDKRLNKLLKESGALNSIKRFEDIVALANDNDMQLIMDYELPGNNRVLHFIKL